MDLNVENKIVIAIVLRAVLAVTFGNDCLEKIFEIEI